MGNTHCPICGSENFSIITITETFKYKTGKIQIPNYKIEHCYNCGEEFTISSAYKRITPQIKQLHLIENVKAGK